MNTYVMIARHLGKVSGEKIYTNNKLKFLVSKGWRVLFLSCKREETLVDGCANYSHYVFPALTYAPECYSRREVKKTIENMAAVVGKLGNDQCIIESDSVNRAAWAELLAKRLNAKHMAFLLQETHPYNADTRKFLRFKYDRHELAGITVQSINLILGDDSAERRADTKIAAYCNNVVEECEDTVSAQLDRQAKYTFGSLGRLDKGCVLGILKAFRTYAAMYPDQKFNLVLIGGATGDRRIQQIREEMEDCGNIHLVITGYMYPVPASLLRRVDLFVSTAGATAVTYRYHRPTVRVHPVTGEPVGIIGLDDLNGKTMYDVTPGVSLVDCIERALASADKITYEYDYYKDYDQKMNAEFERHLSLAGITKEKEYYDEELLLRIRSTHIKGHLWHRVVGRLAGANGLNGAIGLFKKLKKT